MSHFQNLPIKFTKDGQDVSARLMNFNSISPTPINRFTFSELVAPLYHSIIINYFHFLLNNTWIMS